MSNVMHFRKELKKDDVFITLFVYRASNNKRSTGMVVFRTTYADWFLIGHLLYGFFRRGRGIGKA